MTGSHRSPVMKDQWSGDPDRDPRDRDRRRGRGFHRDRGRNRHAERGRPHHPKDRHIHHQARSPPARVSRFGHDASHDLGNSALDRSQSRDSPGLSLGAHEPQRPNRNRPASSTDWNTHPSGPSNKGGPGYRRDESPFPPPAKRKRTRSPSPRGQRGPFPPRRSSFAQYGEGRDRSPSYKNRGRFPGRGASRRRSPRRGRDRRGKDRRRPDFPRPGRSRSPGHGGQVDHLSTSRQSVTPSGGVEDHSDRGSHYRSRSLSQHSVRSVNSRISKQSTLPRDENPARPIRPGVEESTQPPSPGRSISNFDSSYAGRFAEGRNDTRDNFPVHDVRLSNKQDRQRRRGSHSDTKDDATSPRFTPTSPRHGSPHHSPPYSSTRESWFGQAPLPGSSHSLHHRQDNRYYPKNAQPEPALTLQPGPFDDSSNRHPHPHDAPPYRGNQPGHRPSHVNKGPDHRFSGAGSHLSHNGPSHRDGMSHVSSMQWTASEPPNRSGKEHLPHLHSRDSRAPSTKPPSTTDLLSARALNHEYARSANRDIEPDHGRPQMDSDGADSRNDTETMAPTGRDTGDPTPPAKGGKFSFTFKAKTTPAPAPKPVPDLAQRMRAREPPPRAPEPSTPRNRLTNGPMPKFRPEPRFERRDRDRDRGRDRDRDHRDFRDSREFRDPRDRRDDRRFDQRRDRRRGDRRSDVRDNHRREPLPEPPSEPLPKQKKILTRFKPRPKLNEEFSGADSVYFRKPGNESVIGAGTYGKVFKGIHVYTQRKVALKKIRMEGEKDGFPVTAVREIKLLQHLRNHNVVSLLEVMVERNECFMVFEYLSHDLTGLINHPTFSLTLAHKKDLAKQMFEGLSYLHHRGVLHRDIKAANILISNQGLLKFADFGLARFFSKSRQLDYTNRVITIWYRPPELLLGETRYGPAVDVWSAACVCMEMFTKKAVFPGEGGELSQLDKLYNCLGTPTRAEWPDYVEMPWFQLMRPTERKKRVFEDIYREVLSPAALDLISQVFQYDPAKRPSAEQVLQHPYFVSEEPTSQQAFELENMEGDWHEFESKALRKEARRAEHQHQKEREKRKVEASLPSSDRDSKRVRQHTGDWPSTQA